MIISSCLEYRIKTVAVVRIIQLVDPSYLFTLFTSQSVTNLAHSPNFVVTSMSDGFAQKKASRRAATKRKGRNEVDESLIIPGSQRRTQTYKARDRTTETDTPDPPAPQPKRPRVQSSLLTIQEQIDVFDGEIRVISPIDEEEDDFMPEVHPKTLAHHHTFAEILDDSSESDRSAAPKPKKCCGRPPKAAQPAPQVTLTTMNIHVPYLDGKEKAYAMYPMDIDTSLTDMHEKIFELACAQDCSVAKQPNLYFHLLHFQKDLKYGLKTEEDLALLISLYPLEVNKKKKAAVTDITFAGSTEADLLIILGEHTGTTKVQEEIRTWHWQQSQTS
ncbi:hypothetical protein M422DRAFT_50954 [Sphaerobolus stellatus SS14]|uniref:Uncharacterized protein n=1 Tax=Sphaerobolus stellatus (strain SS14) TaxID=990650 RepID=A0A0C9UPA9_SPHS4|nr:hypothetical protein M422DRAFT_50954 [Sphaerobolus stellatus SS14]